MSSHFLNLLFFTADDDSLPEDLRSVSPSVFDELGFPTDLEVPDNAFIRAVIEDFDAQQASVVTDEVDSSLELIPVSLMDLFDDEVETEGVGSFSDFQQSVDLAKNDAN